MLLIIYQFPMYMYIKDELKSVLVMLALTTFQKLWSFQVSLLEKAAQLNREDASILVHLANTYRALSHYDCVEKVETQAKADLVIEAERSVHNRGSTTWRRK
jgi:hypothetical protein